jgi:hypothetical protein
VPIPSAFVDARKIVRDTGFRNGSNPARSKYEKEN